jgi:N-acetylglucosaminyldiphosphoundecaprenol N-acetyl-beta-D-mannosaminyltransferase
MANLSTDFTTGDDLSRDVYCILGMPIDVGGMRSVLRAIETAAAKKVPFFISAPNLNSLVNMRLDPDFGESFLQSDLCPVDGMPIVWIARVLGVPIKERTAGSDIFDALKNGRNFANPLKVFLFGGPEGVAAAACRALNAQPCGFCCVGSHYPGFGSIDEMSRDEIIDEINSSDADFLAVSLGAKKGQLWLQRNRHRLLIPVRFHLGAVVNFQAETIRRAPPIARKLGFEWLWRIKEEPYLWRRYWNDGWVLVRMLFARVLPLIAWTRCLQLEYGRHGQDLVVRQVRDDQSVTVSLCGPAIAPNVNKAIPVFRDAIGTKKRIVINFSNSRAIDVRFLGLLLMLRKKLKDNGADLTFIGLSSGLERIFRLNGLEFLLSVDNGQ